jgi:hypothetical protein
MKVVSTYRLVSLWILFLIASAAASASVISINPPATYLRTEDDPAVASFAFSLASLGISPGQQIQIERLGFYNAFGGLPEDGRSLLAVFSSSDILLAPSSPNRVPGALSAGGSFFSPNTWNGNLTTDIPQDFVIDDGSTTGSTTLQIPGGAGYIFFSVSDSYFTDNADQNTDFGASITVIPEPTISLLFAVGLILAGIRRRVRA